MFIILFVSFFVNRLMMKMMINKTKLGQDLYLD